MPLGTLHLSLPSGQILKIGNGEGNVTANIEVNNRAFFKRCVLYGDIGFGESYVDGEWNTDNITNVIKWFLLNIENAPSISGSKSRNILLNTLRIFNKYIH